ncbi:hypothetical protein F5Y18DRAFT_250665 [Xylariaceae sp. FL1019]|nr:hypothetical protein F5Y18DRAFT_250665 [Xylariaceae sp. FL1019]
MAEITTQLQHAAPRNDELLRILSETDHAASLSQQLLYIKDLVSQLDKIKKDLPWLNWKRTKELKEHESYRDSVMKRWAFKVSGNQERFAAKAEKEEKEYFESLQKLRQAEEMQKHLETLLSEARTTQRQLEQDSKLHETAQAELDGLYASVFQGPTPSFPEEDELERKAENALLVYNAARANSEAAQQVNMILKDADARLRKSLVHIEDALDSSRMDMFGGGAAFDMMERSSLHDAETEVMQAHMLIMQAQRLSPDIRNLPTAKISHGSLMSDVLFDNIFTDMAFHDKIKESRTEVQRCHKALLAQLPPVGQRCKNLDQDARAKKDLLNTARDELQQSRQRIFERLGSSYDPSNDSKQGPTEPDERGAPPPYSQ